MRLFVIFSIIPIIEVGLFITLGRWLTLWPTIGLILLSALIGTYLVRSQGLTILKDLNQRIQDMEDTTSPIAHGALILFAGALLITPGFLTDAIGFSLVIPWIRTQILYRIARWVKPNLVFRAASYERNQRHQQTIIDGEFDDINSHQSQINQKGKSHFKTH